MGQNKLEDRLTVDGNTIDWSTAVQAEFPTLQLNGDNQWYLKIHNDGRVELNENFTYEESAKKFYDWVVNIGAQYRGLKTIEYVAMPLIAGTQSWVAKYNGVDVGSIIRLPDGQY